MADPLRLLWPAVEAVRPAFSRAAIVRWPADDHAALVAAQLILPDGDNPVRIRCPECGRTHVCKVVARKQPDGSFRLFIPCPENLRAEVRQKDLQNWRVNIEQLVSSIGLALSLTGKPKDLASGRVWRCGRTQFGGVLRDVLFARGLRRRDAATFRRAISGSHRPIVFVATELPDPEFWKGNVPTLIRLDEIASLVNGKIEFDVAHVTRLILACDSESQSEAALSMDQLKVLVRQQMKAEKNSALTDDLVYAEYMKQGNLRAAADSLTEQGHPIHFSTVGRRVARFEKEHQPDSSGSVVRDVASQRRNRQKKIQNRSEAKDFE